MEKEMLLLLLRRRNVYSILCTFRIEPQFFLHLHLHGWWSLTNQVRSIDSKSHLFYRVSWNYLHMHNRHKKYFSWMQRCLFDNSKRVMIYSPNVYKYKGLPTHPVVQRAIKLLSPFILADRIFCFGRFDCDLRFHHRHHKLWVIKGVFKQGHHHFHVCVRYRLSGMPWRDMRSNKPVLEFGRPILLRSINQCNGGNFSPCYHIRCLLYGRALNQDFNVKGVCLYEQDLNYW